MEEKTSFDREGQDFRFNFFQTRVNDSLVRSKFEDKLGELNAN